MACTRLGLDANSAAPPSLAPLYPFARRAAFVSGSAQRHRQLGCVFRRYGTSNLGFFAKNAVQTISATLDSLLVRSEHGGASGVSVAGFVCGRSLAWTDTTLAGCNRLSSLAGNDG